MLQTHRTRAGSACCTAAARPLSRQERLRCDNGYLPSRGCLLRFAVSGCARGPRPRRSYAPDVRSARRCRPPLEQRVDRRRGAAGRHQPRARKRPLAGAHRPLGRCSDATTKKRCTNIRKTARCRPGSTSPGCTTAWSSATTTAASAIRSARCGRSKRSTNTAICLSKIDAHYYTDPPWQDITPTRRDGDGHRAGERKLLAQSRRSRSRPAGRAAAGRDRRSFRAAMRFASSRDASAVAAQIARLARQRIGLSETATLLEFTSAAAGGLDHYSAFLTADQLRDIYSQIEGNFVGPGRRAEGRQRRAVDRARDSAQPGREGGHSRRRSHHGVDGQADAVACRPTKPLRCSPARKAAWFA